MERTIFDAWISRQDARTSRSWKNAEVSLAILETCGEPPPGPEAEAPDHFITLAEIATLANDSESGSREREDFDFESYRREHTAKMAAHRPAWSAFRRQHCLEPHDSDFPPAA